MSSRDQALAALEDVERGAYADAAIARHATGSDELSFIRTIVRGVLRWRLRLDDAITRMAGRQLGRIDPLVVQVLRIGLYQIHYMRVPAHAAVAETVALAARRAARAKGFVNAVLRRAASENALGVANDPSIELSHPRWLLERWSGMFGHDRALAIARANQEESNPDLLLNTARMTPTDAEAALHHRQVAFTASPFVDAMYRISGSTNRVTDLIETGLFYPLDEGSVIVARIVQPSQSVLDVAAAPGGKSLAMSLAGSKVTSNDLSAVRLTPLRMMHQRFFDTPARLVVSDGRRAPFRRRFESVLLDAPCSATGTIRKNPEIKWRITPESLQEFSMLQRELLTSALALAEQECVYATCSLEREENDEVVEAVLRPESAFELADLTGRVDPRVRHFVDGGVLRLTPEGGTDGFTAFLLRRRGNSEQAADAMINHL